MNIHDENRCDCSTVLTVGLVERATTKIRENRYKRCVENVILKQ